MKRYTIMAYISLIIIVLLFGFFIYNVSGKNDLSEEQKSKCISEIQYLESEFKNMFNQLNNIKSESYTITTSKIKKEESSSSESSQSSGGEESGTMSAKSEGSEDKSNSSENSSSQDSENNKQYKLEETGILTQNTEIDWKQIKNQVEKIYTSLYPTTLDLYQTKINQEDIINFNKEYDNLTKAVKDENKDETLAELSKLYDYLPKFIESCSEKEKDAIIIKTKNNIFKAYSVLDKEEWDNITANVNNAIQDFTKLVTDINNQEEGNQYNINKTYVMINELQNAVALKDKQVFLIKYKNLVEEIQNL